jgi:Na+/H+ antiporter NhaD/arsenite permease-like protein
MKTTLILLIFGLTYVLIAARRLSLLPIGRPAGALLGAVLMVAVGALTPEESYHAIDHDTIVLLFGTMLLTVYLDNAGFFEWLASKAIALCKSPWYLLEMVALLSALLSAFLVNDTVCLFMTPVVIATCRRAKLPMGPYLIAIATSANIGSAATLVGNPQNMIIGSMSKFPFAQFLMYAGAASLIGVVLNILLLRLYYRRVLPKTMELSEQLSVVVDYRRLKIVSLVTLLVIAGFFAGFHLGYTAVGGCVILILSERKDPREAFSRVDWALLIFFCSLFIVVKALAKTGLVEECWNCLSPHMNLAQPGGVAIFSAFMTIGSQIVSNVPMVMLAGPHMPQLGSSELGWVLLAFVTTVAGNFTLIGSVANIIVAEKAKKDYPLGFFEYLRFGFVSTLLVLCVGVVLLVWIVK